MTPTRQTRSRTASPWRLGAALAAAVLLTTALPTFASPGDGDGHQPPPPPCYDLEEWSRPSLSRGMDYGDAPDTSPPYGTTWPGVAVPYPAYLPGSGAIVGRFPTVTATENAFHVDQPGARHRITTHAWLGDVGAYPVDALPRPLASGDLPPSREQHADLPLDDDLITNLVPALVLSDQDTGDHSIVSANVPADGIGWMRYRVSAQWGIEKWYVNVLIDWNRNGEWGGVDRHNGAPEWAVRNHAVTVPSFTSVLFTSPAFQTGSAPGYPWVRITLSHAPIAEALYGAHGWNGETPPGFGTATGLRGFECGETEDHCGVLYVDPYLQDENQTYRRGPSEGGLADKRCLTGDLPVDPPTPCHPASLTTDCIPPLPPWPEPDAEEPCVGHGPWTFCTHPPRETCDGYVVRCRNGAVGTA